MGAGGVGLRTGMGMAAGELEDGHHEDIPDVRELASALATDDSDSA